ncbi:hypothetical protein L210DRAFT_3434476 [Boletus edulis BED1]|nr:hypothetical protein L210DRAFT_3434476 [Boletus edulis BED1]
MDRTSELLLKAVRAGVSLRTHDIEQFEDDPLEFIRVDLALSSGGSVGGAGGGMGGVGSEASTRRQAAADVLQALVGSEYRTETTEIVGTWIQTGLEEGIVVLCRRVMSLCRMPVSMVTWAQ